MQKLKFSKYQGTGNDFVLLDNRDNHFNHANTKLIQHICHRRFGVGADGLMLLENSKTTSFTMRYYNSDGQESTMCGNGGRCIAAFAVKLGVCSDGESFKFDAVDGIHDAVVKGDVVSLRMVDVDGIDVSDDGMYLDTGSPHFVKFVSDPQKINVFEEGHYWRHHKRFSPGGTNVNFVGNKENGEIEMRTFERGVEDETWSCGTGAVASAMASAIRLGKGNNFLMKVPGGELNVSFKKAGDLSFSDVWLKGMAKFVFEGTIC
jgi:diaminopimelate epimerase